MIYSKHSLTSSKTMLVVLGFYKLDLGMFLVQLKTFLAYQEFMLNGVSK